MYIACICIIPMRMYLYVCMYMCIYYKGGGEDVITKMMQLILYHNWFFALVNIRLGIGTELY